VTFFQFCMVIAMTLSALGLFFWLGYFVGYQRGRLVEVQGQIVTLDRLLALGSRSGREIRHPRGEAPSRTRDAGVHPRPAR
jgi:hypothetical protein